MKFRFASAALLAAAAVCSTTAPAPAQFTAGNITVYQAGDGSGSLVNTGNVVIIKEFSQGGAASSFSLTLPNSGASGPYLIASGTATSEGMMTLGNNGQTLALTGYNRAIGGTGSLPTTLSTDVNRTIGLVNGQGTASFTLLTDYASAGNPRGTYTTNGTDIWAVGSNSGVRYTTAGSTTSTQLATTPTNFRTVQVAGGQLYVSAQTGSTRLATVGTGTPTTGGQTITNLPGFPTSTGSPYQFFFARVGNPSFAGPNVLYVADDGTGVGIQKYIFNGTTWAAAGFVTAAGVRGLTGLVTGNDEIKLFGTTGGSGAAGGGSIYALTDSAAAAGTLEGSAGTIATAGANTAFRGITFAPARLEFQPGVFSTWNLSVTNWTNTAPSSPVADQRFFNAYAANFGNIAVNSTVSVGDGINPAAVNVTNAANTYTFTNGSGTLGIQGLGTLTKSGNGTLILASPNSYSGGTVINTGTLSANNTTGSATGVGSVTVNGGMLRGDGSIAGSVTVNPGGAIRGGSTANPITPLTVLNTVNIIGAATNGGTLAVDLNGENTSGDPVGRISLVGDGVLNFQTTGAGSGPVVIRLLNDGGLTLGNTYTFAIVGGPSPSAFQLNGDVVEQYTHQTDFVLLSSNFSFTGVTMTVDSENSELLLTFTTAPVPEPATVLGVAVAALGLGAAARRRLRRQHAVVARD